MAQTLTMQASEAGPSTSFHASQDFIAFGDFDEVDDENSGEVEEAEEEDSSSTRADTRAPNGTTHKATSSTKANGKKRKVDERIELDGKSKREKKRELARGTPWCVDVDFESCLNQADILHDELMAFADWISPTQKEHETRQMVIHLIRKAIVNQWPDADVHAFGSQNTQLYMPQGDIDLVVVSPRMDDQKRESVLRSMAACLRRNNLATNVQVIARAKVPIVKFVCTYGKYKVDISVNQTNGLDASLFVQGWLQRCPALRPLIMATKLLLSQRGMSEVFSGGLGSYSVICLVISHMQMHPRVQRGEIDPSRNLGVLLLEFLELYGKNFGYDEVGISIIGRGKYFRKAARGWKDDRRPFMLSIEDPGDPTNDISKGSFSILNVRQTFGGAFDIMTAVMCQKPNEKKRRDKKRGQKDEDEEAREALINGARLGESDKDPESLLGNIIGVNREMLKARKDIEELWQSGTLQYKLGRPAPALDPIPFNSDQQSKVKEKHAAPREPKAMRKDEQNDQDRRPLSASKSTTKESERSSKTSNGKIKAKVNGVNSTSQGTSERRKDNSKEPIVVIDDSSSSHPLANDAKQSSRLQLNSREDSPLYEDHRKSSREENAEKDTRYGDTNGGKKKRRSRLDEFARVAPKTFIIDDSASEEEDDIESLEEGEIKEPRSMKKRKTGKVDDAKRRKKREYWENKGNAVGRSISISDDESV